MNFFGGCKALQIVKVDVLHFFLMFLVMGLWVSRAVLKSRLCKGELSIVIRRLGYARSSRQG